MKSLNIATSDLFTGPSAADADEVKIEAIIFSQGTELPRFGLELPSISMEQDFRMGVPSAPQMTLKRECQSLKETSPKSLPTTEPVVTVGYATPGVGASCPPNLNHLQEVKMGKKKKKTNWKDGSSRLKWVQRSAVQSAATASGVSSGAEDVLRSSSPAANAVNGLNAASVVENACPTSVRSNPDVGTKKSQDRMSRDSSQTCSSRSTACAKGKTECRKTASGKESAEVQSEQKQVPPASFACGAYWDNIDPMNVYLQGGFAEGPNWTKTADGYGFFNEFGCLSEFGNCQPSVSGSMSDILALGIRLASPGARRKLRERFLIKDNVGLHEALAFLCVSYPKSTGAPGGEKFFSPDPVAQPEVPDWLDDAIHRSQQSEQKCREMIKYTPIDPFLLCGQPGVNVSANVLDPTGLKASVATVECFRPPRIGMIGILMSWAGDLIRWATIPITTMPKYAKRLVEIILTRAGKNVPKLFQSVATNAINKVEDGSLFELRTTAAALNEPRVLLKPEGHENTARQRVAAILRSIFGTTTRGLIRHSTIKPYKTFVMDLPKAQDTRATNLAGVAISDKPQLIVAANVEDHTTGRTRTVLYCPQIVDQIMSTLRLTPAEHREGIFDRRAVVSSGPLNVPGEIWAVANEGSVAVAQAMVSNLDVKVYDRTGYKSDFQKKRCLVVGSAIILLGVVIAPGKSLSLACQVSKQTLKFAHFLVRRIGDPLCKRAWGFMSQDVPRLSRIAATRLRDLLGLFIVLAGRLQNRIFKYS